MKTILLCLPLLFRKQIFKQIIGASVLLFSFSTKVSAQTCIAGYTSASINWDNLDYLHSNGYYGLINPVTGQPFVTAAMRQTQKFAIGTNFLTLTTTIGNNSGGTLSGDVTTHTGETGAYGFGADVHFVKTGTVASTITLTFDHEVRNLNFSLFDIDQEITFAPTATNASGTAQNITLTKPAGTASAIPLNGNAAATTVTGTAPLANWGTGGGSGTQYALTDNRGTINVDIAGPLKTVTLTFSNDGNNNDFFLSDIHACINNSTNPTFPIHYHKTYTEPWVGQPSYFLANPQSLHVYMVDPTATPNPTAQYIFSDPGTGGTKMNSLAYDPVGHYMYYVMDNAPSGLGGPPANFTLKRYNFNTEQIETVVSDVRTLGIPCFEQGVEFAGAAFYNGSLYLGVEGTDGVVYDTDAESIIWRIDFDASYNVVRAVQVYATPGDDGVGTVMHDWGDFIVKDSAIITHATSGSTNNSQYIHVKMQSNTSTVYAGNAQTAGQLGMTYDGAIYQTKAATALYNNNGTIGTQTTINVTSCSPAWIGAAGDASDPFKPKADFGDAPATYDPIALSPAVNDSACNNTTLRIGSAWGREWAKLTSSNATGDDEEDGISTVTILNANGATYNHVQQVSVLNNTGGTITYAAWLDYNFNGVFDALEGRTITIGSSASLQTVTFAWNSLNIPTAGAPTSTFLRIRTASTAMTSSNATGWFADGETEDYLVPIANVALAINLIDFNALANANKTVDVKWSAISTEEGDQFEIQRSRDQINWTVIGTKEAGLTGAFTAYSLTDTKPYAEKSYYRLRLIEENGNSRFSNIKSVYLPVTNSEMTIAPNPANNNAIITITGTTYSTANLKLRSLTGQTVISKTVTLTIGENRIAIDVSGLNPGIYIAELRTKDRTISSKLSVTR